MAKLTKVSETLYVPLLGRIYATRYQPWILCDAKALDIEERLPDEIKDMRGQDEYTYLASAVRAKNVDYYIKAFLQKHPKGIIVNIGCGLETAFYRSDNGNAMWYELDLPEVLKLRRGYFAEQERDRYLPSDMFDYGWIDVIRKESAEHVLVVAAGIFYYFEEKRVTDFIKHLSDFGEAELVFDVVSSAGMKRTKRFMEKMGRQEAQMFFSLDNTKKYLSRIPGASLLEKRRFYSLVGPYAQHPFMSSSTKMKMRLSDLFGMVNMVHLRIEQEKVTISDYT